MLRVVGRARRRDRARVAVSSGFTCWLAACAVAREAPGPLCHRLFSVSDCTLSGLPGATSCPLPNLPCVQCIILTTFRPAACYTSPSARAARLCTNTSDTRRAARATTSPSSAPAWQSSQPVSSAPASNRFACCLACSVLHTSSSMDTCALCEIPLCFW